MIWPGYKHLLWVIVLIFFLAEGALIPWLLPPWTAEMGLAIVPRLAFICILYIAIYLNRHMAVAMGLVFGLLHDIIFYGLVLGTYAFGMGITTYLIGLMLRDTHVTWYTGIGSILFGLLLFDVSVYGLYLLFQLANETPLRIFLYNMLPTLIFNLSIALLMYWPVLKGFSRIEKYVTPVESEHYPAGNP